MTERWIAEEVGAFRRFEGDISSHAGFRGWMGGKHEQAFVLLDGRLCVVHKQRARTSESRQCAHNCKKAHPLTACLCICGGENHGSRYDGHVEIDANEEAEWDKYVDAEFAPAM
jgi:hypothetical protein